MGYWNKATEDITHDSLPCTNYNGILGSDGHIRLFLCMNCTVSMSCIQKQENKLSTGEFPYHYCDCVNWARRITTMQYKDDISIQTWNHSPSFQTCLPGYTSRVYLLLCIRPILPVVTQFSQPHKILHYQHFQKVQINSWMPIPKDVHFSTGPSNTHTALHFQNRAREVHTWHMAWFQDNVTARNQAFTWQQTVGSYPHIWHCSRQEKWCSWSRLVHARRRNRSWT